MAAVILKIGSVDLSMIAEQEGVRIHTAPVYGEKFTNVLGKERKKLIGESIDISAEFGNVPEELAKKIVSACENDNIPVEFKNPNTVTAIFDRPSVDAVPSFAASEDERYWNISLSMVCPLKGDGL